MAHVLESASTAEHIPQDLPDMERFRLRAFVQLLAQRGEVETIDRSTPLGDVAAHLDGAAKAVLFRDVEGAALDLVGNVMGSRERLALALGVPLGEMLQEVNRRLKTPIPPVEVASSDAPVHQVILRGDDADLTALPIHLQHHRDGAPFISASLDYVVDPRRGWTNVGCRRLMLRGRHETGVDLNAPSDLRVIYQEAVEGGERLPVTFVIGSHPLDYIAATTFMPPMDEIAMTGALREAPVPMVRGVSNGVMIPADAELALEGYLDERGFAEPEGPYGEYAGYYGRLKTNPVFHLTAITMRRDALFQTATISGKRLDLTDTAQLVALRTEAAVWAALEQSVREPVAVCASGATGGMYNVRIAMRPRYPGEARNAIASAFGSFADLKHVFVVNDDIDVFSDAQMDFALGTRFQADRDLVVASGFRAVPLDPSLDGRREGAKLGFDLTLPFGRERSAEFEEPTPPRYAPSESPVSVEAALGEGPKLFVELMAATGSRDGRDIVLALEALRARISRTAEGRYAIDQQEGQA